MKTQETIQLLRAYESRNVLFTDPDGSWPIVWERAKGVNVWDADGEKYLDLTAAFGVAAVQRELALIKVRADPARRSQLLEVAAVFRANVVDMGPETLVLEPRSTPP